MLPIGCKTLYKSSKIKNKNYNHNLRATNGFYPLEQISLPTKIIQNIFLTSAESEPSFFNENNHNQIEFRTHSGS